MTGRTRATTAISGVPHDMSNYCIRRKIRQFSQGHRFVFLCPQFQDQGEPDQAHEEQGAHQELRGERLGILHAAERHPEFRVGHRG